MLRSFNPSRLSKNAEQIKTDFWRGVIKKFYSSKILNRKKILFK